MVRLRPVVRATATADGLHLRGWASSCTLTGGAGLWKVWERLAPQLVAGVESPAVPAGTAPAVRAAAEMILRQLQEHDMLVEVPTSWGLGGPSPEVAAWLESVAADPAAAWSRLRAVVVVVTGAGLAAEAAVRSAEAVGLAVRRSDVCEPGAGDAFGCCGDGEPAAGRTEPVVPRGSSHEPGTGRVPGQPGNSEPAARHTGSTEPAVPQADAPAPVGSPYDRKAAAHNTGSTTLSAPRAAAPEPDTAPAPEQRSNSEPAARHTSSPELAVSAGGLTVLAACGAEVGYVLPTSESLTSFNTEVINGITARLGLTGEPGEVLAALVGSAAVHRLVCAVAALPDPATVPGEPATGYPLALVARAAPLRATYHPVLTGPPPPDPWHRLDALTDPELGMVDTPLLGDLPQVPANLATSAAALGIGTSADSARLDAALGSLKAGGVLGITERHARGAALRLAASALDGEPAPAHEWTAGRTSHRWWKALTERFGRPAVVEVRKLAPNAYKAEIRQRRKLLAWAVEATAEDAVAFAALAATGHAQAGREGTAHLNGAAPRRKATVPAWAGPEWLWPDAVQDNEEKLQQALEPLVRIAPVPLDPELTAAGLVAYAVHA
ncbi:hypothetical protein SAMN05216188_108124 [Lentzea xinjiangensis]|uniref:Uncharacterized protein n=1 Tax=Lentzea xinjiangensis TaxID=402600 RepID=A0A1H9LVN7_9PSEU|nr:hypothetical protein SAMN05216188_108124 [Lentzea xinjiangensis]